MLVLLVGCVPKTNADDDVGETGETETDAASESDTGESDTTDAATSESESDTGESDTTDAATSESESDATGETGDDPFEVIPTNEDWFGHTQHIAHRRLGDDEQLLLGGAEQPLGPAGVLAIDLDGTTRWKSVESWPEPHHWVDDLLPRPDGGTHVTGWTFDEGTLADGPSWIWLGELDFDGEWIWLVDTPHGNEPASTALRPDGSATILHWVFFGYGMHDFSPTGEHRWSLDWWGSDLRLAFHVVAVPGAVISGGSESIGDTFRPTERWLWFQRISDAGEPLDEVVYPGPAGAHDHVLAMQFDPAAQTVEVLITREFGMDDSQALWATLDVDDLALLHMRELGPGWSRRLLELDGQGGAWIAIDHGDAPMLHHFDAEGSETWSAEIGEWYDIAIDHETPRAYVLMRDEAIASGILVVDL